MKEGISDIALVFVAITFKMIISVRLVRPSTMRTNIALTAIKYFCAMIISAPACWMPPNHMKHKADVIITNKDIPIKIFF